MIFIDYDNLGINEDTLVIHIDDYATMRGHNLSTLCGLNQKRIWPYNYNLFEIKHFKKPNKICKKCNKIARKKGYDIATTLVHLKLVS